MDYEVILTYPAKAQLDHAINYILCEFESEQAALSVLNDAEDTRSRLSHVADSLKLCDDPKLRALGYRTKSATTSSTGGLLLALQTAIVTARP